MKITRVKDKAVLLSLGDQVNSVLTEAGHVQIKTLQFAKTKGGMRDCFIPAKGRIWVSADYSAQELRLAANFSNEQGLIEPILKGEDPHKHVGMKMFGSYDPTHRTIAKTINFASLYGAQGYTIGKRLKKSAEEGQELLDRYNKSLPNLTRWKSEMEKEGRRKGIVFTYFGRPRAVWMYYQSSSSSDRSFGDRTCVNTVVQGSAGDIIRIDHVKYYEKINNLSKTYDEEFAKNVDYAISVHDEINFFVNPSYLQQAYYKIKELMECQFPNWRVPLTISISFGVDWGHQIDVLGFDETGVMIPDAEEDLTLL